MAAARRRAAARAAAQRRAARIASARRRAKVAAQRRAAKARANSTRLKQLSSDKVESTPKIAAEPAAKLWPEASTSGSARGAVIPIVGLLGSLALLLLIVALIPARAAPWYWAERILAARQQQFALTGVIGLISVGASLAVVFLTG